MIFLSLDTHSTTPYTFGQWPGMSSKEHMGCMDAIISCILLTLQQFPNMLALEKKFEQTTKFQVNILYLTVLPLQPYLVQVILQNALTWCFGITLDWSTAVLREQQRNNGRPVLVMYICTWHHGRLNPLMSTIPPHHLLQVGLAITFIFTMWIWSRVAWVGWGVNEDLTVGNLVDMSVKCWAWRMLDSVFLWLLWHSLNICHQSPLRLKAIPHHATRTWNFIVCSIFFLVPTYLETAVITSSGKLTFTVVWANLCRSGTCIVQGWVVLYCFISNHCSISKSQLYLSYTISNNIYGCCS